MSDDDSTEGGGIVIDLHGERITRPRFGDAKLVIHHQEKPGFCGHEYVTLKRTRRIVVCRRCGAEVSAFEVLVDVARSWENVTYNRAELDRIAARVEELKREEALTKARIRNARKGAEESGQVDVYFAELLRRINEATTYGQLHDASAWASSYNWLRPEQTKAVRDAMFAAKQRAEASARHPVRKRAPRVIKGGAS